MRLTITQISQVSHKGKPVWVLNKSHGKERGPVIFNCPKTNGSGVDAVYVPNTFVPINLIELITWERLVESVPFRQAVSRGLLHIIDDMEAQEILAMDGAEEELERLRLSEARYASVSSVEGVEVPDIIGAGSMADAESGLPPHIMGILARIEEQGEVAVINSLRSYADEFTLGELKGIFGYAKTNGHKRIMKWAKQQRDSLS